jgi:hypothetical protein
VIIVADRQRHDLPASRIGDLHLMTVAVGIDPDDGIYYPASMVQPVAQRAP